MFGSFVIQSVHHSHPFPFIRPRFLVHKHRHQLSEGVSGGGALGATGGVAGLGGVQLGDTEGQLLHESSQALQGLGRVGSCRGWSYSSSRSGGGSMGTRGLDGGSSSNGGCRDDVSSSNGGCRGDVSSSSWVVLGWHLGWWGSREWSRGKQGRLAEQRVRWSFCLPSLTLGTQPLNHLTWGWRWSRSGDSLRW